MPERILVVGGLGFVGANLVRYLLGTRPDAEVWVLDALAPAANPDNLREVEVDPRYRFWCGGLEVPEHVRTLCLKGVTTVVNCAHRTGFDGAGEAMVQTNVEGVRVLCEAAAEAGVSRVVHVSTTAVYGEDAGGVGDDALPDPRDPYSATRAAGDLLALAYYRAFGVPVSVVRLPELFGPYGPPSGLVAAVAVHVLAGRPLYRAVRDPAPQDWLYVGDAVAALARVIRAGEPGRAYNVVAGERKTEFEVAMLVVAAAGGDPDLVDFGRAGGSPRASRPAPLEAKGLQGTGVRALGWEPQWNLADGIAETVDWYRSHEPWWRRIEAGEHLMLQRRLQVTPPPGQDPWVRRPATPARGATPGRPLAPR